MKLKMGLAMLLMSLCSGAAFGQDSNSTKLVKIKRKAAAVGQACTQKLTTNIDSKIVGNSELDSKEKKYKAVLSSEYTMTINAMKGTNVSKMLVACKADKIVGEGTDGKVNKESPIVGRSFRLERREAGMIALDSKGGALNKNTTQWLIKTHGNRARDFVSDVVKVLPKRALKIGESFTLKKSDLAGLPAGTEVRPCTVIIKGMKEVNGVDCAVFHIKAEGSDSNQGAKSSFKSREVQYVELATGWIVKQIQVVQTTTVTKEKTNKVKFRVTTSKTYKRP